MARPSGLVRHLATLDAGALLALLQARPDAALPPQPGELGELAGRLQTVHSVTRALHQLDLPALQAVEALLALGARATRAALAGLLGADDGERQRLLDRALADLGRLALLWPVGDELEVPAAMRALIPDPLALGGPAHALLGQLTVAQLGQIGAELGVGECTRKAQWVAAVAAAMGDPTGVAARLAAAPPALADAVRRIAWQGPRVSGVRLPSPYERRRPGPETQLAVRGWVVAGQWGGVGEMPCEVGLAVRGRDYRAPFDLPPPPPPAAAVHPPRLLEASRHAAGRAVDAVRRLLALVDGTPVALLQAGGVGVRELRRLARALGGDEAAARLWLELVAAAGLVTGTQASDVVLTSAADGWLEVEPGEGLAGLVTAWSALPVVPTGQVDGDGKPVAALAWTAFEPGAVPLRTAVLRALAALTPARGLADPGDASPLARALAHHRPLTVDSPETAEQLVRATLREAALLGLVADGALTPLGSALLDTAAAEYPAGALATAAAGLLPAPARTATFLPDLTAVVPGAVAPALGRLLDAIADAETRDTASTWRFSPASVRRALDGGRDADALLAELAAVAAEPLPQPLEYLVRDVARRHGELAVVPAACCVVAADASLAAEVVGHRKLAGLRLRLLGTTVLASGKPAGETLTALRAAGYAPVHRTADGAAVIEKRPTRRANGRRSAYPMRFGPAGLPVDGLPELARRLAAR